MNESNVKFLTKEPVVGLKLFNGEYLTKRLQITFAAEGHFNLFARKIQQWLGLSLGLQYPDSSQGPANNTTLGPNSQHAMDSSSLNDSQSQSQGVSQIFTQVSCSQNEGFLLSQVLPREETDVLSQGPNLSHSYLAHQRGQEYRQESDQKAVQIPQDSFRLLLNAAMNDTSFDSSAISEAGFNNNEQYNGFNSTKRVNPNFFAASEDTNLSFNLLNAQSELIQTITNIPFQSKKKKREKSSRKMGSIDRAFEKTIYHIIDEQKGSLLAMDDTELSMKVVRKLRSRNFLKLLKRVENLI